MCRQRVGATILHFVSEHRLDLRKSVSGISVPIFAESASSLQSFENTAEPIGHYGYIPRPTNTGDTDDRKVFVQPI